MSVLSHAPVVLPDWDRDAALDWAARELPAREADVDALIQARANRDADTMAREAERRARVAALTARVGELREAQDAAQAARDAREHDRRLAMVACATIAWWRVLLSPAA